MVRFVLLGCARTRLFGKIDFGFLPRGATFWRRGTLEAPDDIVDAFGSPDRILKGTRCRFLGQDFDGDFRLQVGGKRTTAFFSDLESLDLV